MIRSLKIRWAEYIERRNDMKNVHKTLVGKSKETRKLGRKRMGACGLDSCCSVTDHCPVVVGSVMNLGFLIKDKELLD
jgi:hypothetical protein